MNSEMKGETALYRVVKEGFLEEVMFMLRMKNEKEPVMWRLEGKDFRQKEGCKLMAVSKDDSGLFELLKEDQSAEKRDQCQSNKRPGVKALVVISTENHSWETAVSPPPQPQENATL